MTYFYNKREPIINNSRYFHKQQGFTLLELIIVLIITVLGVSALAFKLSSGNNATELKAAAREIVSALRYARGQALMTHAETALIFNLANNTYQVGERDKIYSLSKSIDITLVTAQNELKGNTGAIRFFPDGSTTGGRVTLESAHLKWQIDVNWLTGQIILDDKNEN